MTIVVLRVGLAAAALLPFAALRGRLPGGLSVWLACAVMDFLKNVPPFTPIVQGQAQIASGFAEIFNATTPIVTWLVAHSLTGDECPTAAQSVGVLLGFTSVAVVLAPDLFQETGESSDRSGSGLRPAERSPSKARRVSVGSGESVAPLSVRSYGESPAAP